MLKRNVARTLISIRSKGISAEDHNVVTKEALRLMTKPEKEETEVQKVANESTVFRPPYYRIAHENLKEAKHILQEEFPNAGDASGAGVRLYDYYKTAEIVHSLPTIKEKIDFVSPYERPWTRAEKTWRRDWHPSLMATRKAWGIPVTPMYFDTFHYYQNLTKTRVEHGSLDEYYHGLRPPTQEFNNSFISTLDSMGFGDGMEFDDEKTQKLLGAMIDDAMGGIAHNVSRLADQRVAYDVASEAFWIRSGFAFLYNEPEKGTGEEKKRIFNFPKYIGDDRRKLGELAFVHRDKLAAQVRSRDPLTPYFPLDSEDAKLPVFDENMLSEWLQYSPKVYNFWPDSQPLWQCPGYHADSDESHSYGVLAVKSLRPLRQRVAYWMGWENDKDIDDVEEAKQMFDEAARSQAVVSLFTTLCAQAHCHGFTQYTDVTRPFTSQLILSDGINFYFAVGQLNTLAINIECEGFVNPKSNFVRIEGPFRLFNLYDTEEGYKTAEVSEETKEVKVSNSLNHKVLERITQMLMKQ
ncbi:unnamed protein product [Caenorhabditis bovis]|uniref:Uncharacterized protein n=1 Tax=Caenorhabditis bovis TaxID=2654633 RepID=A0A8S1F8Z2_9PELO|nr:unnamed protein product [Caenorhabditis bovis]